MAKIESVRELEAYKMAFEAAMRIFRLTKIFPAEERFSLTDQIRRASRSVCTNLSEGCIVQRRGGQSERLTPRRKERQDRDPLRPLRLCVKPFQVQDGLRLH